MYNRTPILICIAVVGGLLHAQTTRNVPAQFATIQAAITASSNGDTVLVAPGTYAGPITFAGKTIRVMSSGGAAVTFISGLASGVTVTFAGGEGPATVFSGFTMNGGNGAILCQNASPQIQNCVVSNQLKTLNTTGGGALRCVSSGASVCSPAISGCAFSGNVAAAGGAISFEPTSVLSSSPTITNCVFDANFAFGDSGFPIFGGGAIRVTGVSTTVTVTGCTFTNNRSEAGATGLFARDLGVLALSNSRLTNNGGSSGSPVLVISSTLCTLTNCVVAANTNAAAIVGTSPAVGPNATTIRNCTIYGNTAPVGASVYFAGGPVALNIQGSIIRGNAAFDLNATAANGVTATVVNSDVGIGVFPPSPTNINVDPLFVDAAGGDLHLSRSSPCRDAGGSNTVGLPATDIDGSARVVGAAVDMGADEIPLDAYPGTADSLDLYATVATGGDPLAPSRTAAPGSLLRVALKSPNGSMTGALPILGGQLYPTGSPPVINTPGIWLEATAFIITGALPSSPFSAPGLPPAGLPVAFQVPPGLGGWTFRLQGFTSSAFAANTVFAASEALEVTF